MGSSKNFTVVVVDDRPMICKLIAEFVETVPGVKVVGTANSIQDALDCVTNLEPAAVILDINMPSFGLMQSGIDVLRWIKARYPVTEVIMLTMHTDNIYRRTCQALGAYTLIEKASGTELLAEALTELVARGERSQRI